MALPAMDAQAGFALMEVLISAVILALIVVATFTGFDVADHASADERARAQADVLAQQDEDHLRSLQINEVSHMNETQTIEYQNTKYTIASTGEFVADATGATSCSTTTSEASYVRTTTTVTWPGAGVRDPVVETGLITPPAGGELLVKIINARGEPISGMTVEAIGPSPSTGLLTASTGVKGCAIFAGLTEGEYKATAFQTGYVEEKSGESQPSLSEQAVTVVPGSTAKKEFPFDRPGALAVSFSTTNSAETTGDTFVTQSTGIPTPGFFTFGTASTYTSTITTPKTLYPFASPYAVYAGTCEADEPSQNGQPEGANQSATVLPGETIPVTVLEPAVNMVVHSGTAASSGEAVTKLSGTLKDEGCGGQLHTFSTSTATNGVFAKGMPFGKFTLCVVSTEKVGSPSEYRKLKSTVVENKNPLGSSVYNIYLGSGEHHTSGPYTCP